MKITLQKAVQRVNIDPFRFIENDVSDPLKSLDKIIESINVEFSRNFSKFSFYFVRTFPSGDCLYAIIEHPASQSLITIIHFLFCYIVVAVCFSRKRDESIAVLTKFFHT